MPKKSEDYQKTKKTIIILFTDYEIENLKGIEKYISRWHIREDEYANYILTKKLDIARNMLEEKISIETIIKCTGLTKEEIEKIQ